MDKIVIIGGGLAGLSAAVSLSSKNYPVLLIEASPSPGGKIFSFYDKQFDSLLDNGQHIMMGCYKETLNFLRTINALENFYFQENLEVTFFDKGKYCSLKTGGSVYPVNFLQGILSFRLFNIKERFELINFFIKLPVSSVRDTEKISAEEWLVKNNQGEKVRKVFWDTFIIGTMNTTPEKASAFLLRKVLLRVFFSGRGASAIIIPSKPLKEAFGIPAVNYLKKNNAEVSFPERVTKLQFDLNRKKIEKIITNRRIITGFRAVITAVPLYSLKKIIHIQDIEGFDLNYSPILTIHFKSKKELFPHRFIAFKDSPVHWIFKHTFHYTIVISSADELINLPVTKLKNFISRELIRLFDLNSETISDIKVVKEKRATFIPGINAIERPESITSVKNLFLAGDWTNTELPATIEGAVLSGVKAAEEAVIQ